MALNLTPPDISELKPRITVFGVGGAGGNAVNNMITAGLQGVDFVVANTDAEDGNPRFQLADVRGCQIECHGCLSITTRALVRPGRRPRDLVNVVW